MSRLRYWFVVAVAMAGFPRLAQAPPTAKIVTPPKEHFGFELGDDYCLGENYKQLESYWKKLEKQTDRMKVVSIGKTEEGRDHLMAIVSSPANIAKLDRYKEIARKLATAEATPEEAAKLAEEGKAIVWIDGGLHASEVLCAQVLIETVYRYVVATDAESLRILDDVIILFAHANPDGMDLCADWYSCAEGGEAVRAIARRFAATLRKYAKSRQQPRFLREQPGRNEEHEPGDVPGVVPADRVRPPPDRPGRGGGFRSPVPGSE